MLHSQLLQQIENALQPPGGVPLDGWCTLERAGDLACQVIGLRPAQSVVIGVWGGRDTFALGMAHKEIGYGKVLAVDPWKATASVIGQEGADADWWANQDMHELVHDRFQENLQRFGLQEWVDVRRATADEVTPPPHIGLLIIDGNHGPQAVRDVDRYAVNVERGGILFMDDVKWKGQYVEEAIAHVLQLGFRQLFYRDNGIFFQRK